MDIVKKKIAILCNYELLIDRIGGMDYFFWMFDEKCKQQNIHVDWFFPNNASHGNYPKLSIISSNCLNVEDYFSQQDYISEYSFILTHFVELCTAVFQKIKQKTTAKIVAVDHNPRPLNGYRLGKRIKKRIKGIVYAKYIDLFIGVSNYTVNEILKDFGNNLKSKTTTIYNGVFLDDILVKQYRKSQKPKFLVVSHLRESKGIQDLIISVSNLPESVRSELKIDVFGDGPYKSVLTDLVEKFKLKSVFDFKGSVSNLKEIYCDYDYMLQPTHMECFSLSILESLAANIPVITTNVGGNKEAVTNGINGFIFLAKDTLVLTEIIAKLFTGEFYIAGDTRRMIEQNFSLDKMVENYFKLIN